MRIRAPHLREVRVRARHGAHAPDAEAPRARREEEDRETPGQIPRPAYPINGQCLIPLPPSFSPFLLGSGDSRGDRHIRFQQHHVHEQKLCFIRTAIWNLIKPELCYFLLYFILVQAMFKLLK